MVEVSTEAAYEMVKRMARTAGVLLGVSGGAALVAAETIVREGAATDQPAVIVAVLPDSGDRYLSENFWNE